MGLAANKIDLELSESCESRLTTLAAALPADLAKESERWNNRFFGRAQARKRYAILRHPLTVPETLASVNFYGAECDEVSLTDEEVRPLLSGGDPAIKSLDQGPEKLVPPLARKKTLTVRWGGIAVA
jgi:hypothetical protein